MLASADYSTQVWLQGNMAATDVADLKDLVARVCRNDVRKDLKDEDFRRLQKGKYTSKLFRKYAKHGPGCSSRNQTRLTLSACVRAA